MAVMAGLVVPNFGNTYQNIQLEKTTEDLAYLMSYAQARAITTNRQFRLEFDTDFSTYWLSHQKIDDEAQPSEEFERMAGRMGREFRVPNKITVEASEPFINFYPDGNIDKERIYLSNAQDTHTISTQEQKGFVKVYDSRME